MAIRLTSPNLVMVDSVREWVVGNLPALYLRTRDERQVLEERWLHYFKMWSVELDQPSYTGRSQVYLAAARAALETWLVNLMQGLFPVTDWFKVVPIQHVTGQRQADRWAAMQRYFLTHDMDFESEVPLFLRQYLTFGTGILRHVWSEEEERHRFFERQLQDAPLDTEAEEVRLREEEDGPDELDVAFDQDGTVVRLVEKLVKTHAGPKGLTVDLFHFYVAPITTRSIQAAQLAFEDMAVPLSHLEEMHQRWMDPQHPDYGRVYDHPEWESFIAKKGKLTTEYLYSLQERWQRLGIEMDPNRVYHGGLDKKGTIQLTESYWRGEIPGALDEQGTPYGKRDWLIVWADNLTPIRIQLNPFYKQLRPWVDARMFRTTTMYYAQGVMDAIASVQYLLNDIGNLTLDNLTMALNPVVTVDEDLVTNMESLQWAPGAKWFVAKDGVNVLNLPTQAQLGMATMNMMQGFVHDFSGASAANQGVPPARGRGRVAQTASGYAQLQATGGQAFTIQLKELERQLCIPVLTRNYALAEQFLVEKKVLQILGEEGAGLITEPVGFEDIFGDYRYEWRGSVGLRERTALLTTLQSFPQMIMQSPPEVQQAFQWVEFYKLMLADGANVTWYDRIFKTADDQPTIDPKLENDILAAHRTVNVHPGDDDGTHLQVHGIALIQDDRFLRDPVAKQLAVQHIQQHMAQQQQKIQAQQQQQIMGVVHALLGGNGSQGPQGAQGNPMGGMNAKGSLPAPTPPMNEADMMRSQQ